MSRGLAYCKRAITAEKAHPWRKQISSANHPICYNHFLFNSIALFSSSSSRKSSSLHNYYIRKRRKWPIQPYKTQWPQNFAFRLAKQSFKQSIRKNKTHLLSDLINSFSAYEINPTPQSYHFLFKILIQNRRLTNCHDQIQQILDHIEKNESFETPECIFIDLIKFYGDVDMFSDAVELFMRIPRFRCEPSVEILNALLSILCINKMGLELIPQILVKSSQVMKIRVEESSFGILIKALCKIGSLSNAYDLMNQMVDEGFCVDQKVCSIMLATICRQMNCDGGVIMGFIEDLKKLGFEPKRDDFCNVIRFLVKKEASMDALGLLKQMKVNGIKPDIMCYNLVLDGLIHSGDFLSADKVFDELLVLGLTPDNYTYNVYISGLIMQKKVDDGLQILRSMEGLGCKPESSTYSTILRAMCEAGEMDRVTEVVSEMRKKCMRLNACTYKILIDGFISDGLCSKAVELFGEEVVNDILCKFPTSSD
ncbi:pentatricopeptide repeat-containing protein at2g38420 mitochondrial [Phtheirospermum japonicum]|uniref:Pentatricopeptide repeat-containing protein at2g38420 mitochondrial n=1 Tax=Phtheirospermum japonicum TaxID=374723 RepID=A0A830BDK3_9LAMI|nr:pentatricopeptide repeat-containing protein at2g38420 mitochondrial [Phtheirospermum japonicum]